MGLGTGAAYIFVENGGIWEQEDKLFADLPDASDLFGEDVGVSEVEVGSKENRHA